jgi:hypothetical protein
MNLKHISLVSIPVTDQDKAKDLYTGTLITQERDGS